ncbi:tyrosine-type recombinase/integrase [Orenia marismortui]|nr:tyrosine-type recombinase/integrase [Orenia marismortui]
MGRSKKLPYILSDKEQNDFLKIFNSRYPTQERNKAMVKLMLDTGLRLSEVINLKWNNVDFNAESIDVKEGKGGKDRVVWFGQTTKDILANWKKRQNKELNKKEAENKNNLVFTSLTGNKLNQRNVRRMIYKYADKAGIQDTIKRVDSEGNEYVERKVTPHTLRHTFATDTYRKSKNLLAVKKALGHSDISTTQIYTHLVDDELEEIMKGLRE